MSLAMITFVPLAIGLGFLYWASQLDEEHHVLQLVFQLLFIPLCWISINFALIDARLIYSSDAELVKGLADMVFYLGWVFFIIGAYIVYRLFVTIKDWILQKKMEKEEEDYG